MPSYYSIIIPTLNAGPMISKTLESVSKAMDGREHEVIVVDGGSEDSTFQALKNFSVRLLESERGRGIQLNCGARAAAGDIFIFLHADTALPKDAGSLIAKYFQDKNVNIAKFQMCFDSRGFWLKIYSWMAKFDSVLTSYGDQCLVVRRGFFEKTGGFPEWKLFEDVKFLQEARKRAKIYLLPGKVTTSAEKFHKAGTVRQQWRNARLMFDYLRGVSPDTLYEKYYR